MWTTAIQNSLSSEFTVNISGNIILLLLLVTYSAFSLWQFRVFDKKLNKTTTYLNSDKRQKIWSHKTYKIGNVLNLFISEVGMVCDVASPFTTMAHVWGSCKSSLRYGSQIILALYLIYNLPQINRLQQIQNFLARTVVPEFSHITPVLRSLHWLKINKRIEYILNPSHSPKKFSKPANRTIYICIFLITNHQPLFRCASPNLWNQLPSSFRQPHPIHSPRGSTHLASITSVQIYFYHSVGLLLQT